MYGMLRFCFVRWLSVMLLALLLRDTSKAHNNNNNNNNKKRYTIYVTRSSSSITILRQHSSATIMVQLTYIQFNEYYNLYIYINTITVSDSIFRILNLLHHIIINERVVKSIHHNVHSSVPQNK